MYINRPISEWDESDVQEWFSSLGYAQYESQIREHKIAGDVLCMLNSEGLKTLGVASVGQRLSILKSLYNLKVEEGIPLDEDDYIPPSEVSVLSERIAMGELQSSLKEQSRRLRALEDDNKTLANVMSSFADEMAKLRSSIGASKESPNKPLRKNSTPQEDVSLVNHLRRPSLSRSSTSESTTAYATPGSSASSFDTGYSSKVSLDDPTWKVLPAALKKHGNDDDWREYVMFISYGPPGNRIKRRLELDEKPLFLFKKLKDAQKNPAFVLKKMNDLRYHLSVKNSTAIPFSSGSRDSLLSEPNQSYLYPTPPLSFRSITPDPFDNRI